MVGRDLGDVVPVLHCMCYQCLVCSVLLPVVASYTTIRHLLRQYACRYNDVFGATTHRRWRCLFQGSSRSSTSVAASPPSHHAPKPSRGGVLNRNTASHTAIHVQVQRRVRAQPNTADGAACAEGVHVRLCRRLGPAPDLHLPGKDSEIRES